MQHGFLCSQYYLGYFKCILQDYSKKYYNISFPYINRWTSRPYNPVTPDISFWLVRTKTTVLKIVTLLAKSTPDLLKLTWVGPAALFFADFEFYK